MSRTETQHHPGNRTHSHSKCLWRQRKAPQWHEVYTRLVSFKQPFKMMAFPPFSLVVSLPVRKYGIYWKKRQRIWDEDLASDPIFVTYWLQNITNYIVSLKVVVLHYAQFHFLQFLSTANCNETWEDPDPQFPTAHCSEQQDVTLRGPAPPAQGLDTLPSSLLSHQSDWLPW